IAVPVSLAAGQICVADEVDELFQTDPVQTATLDFSDAALRAAAALSEQGSENGQLYSPEADWRGTRSEVLETESADESADLENKESETQFAVSLVPEPSAIGLAALALTYFLLFGRRRTIS